MSRRNLRKGFAYSEGAYEHVSSVGLAPGGVVNADVLRLYLKLAPLRLGHEDVQRAVDGKLSRHRKAPARVVNRGRQRNAANLQLAEVLGTEDVDNLSRPRSALDAQVPVMTPVAGGLQAKLALGVLAWCAVTLHRRVVIAARWARAQADSACPRVFLQLQWRVVERCGEL